MKVVTFAKERNNSAAARQYGVTEKMVRDWRSKEEALKNIPRTKCASRGQAAHWPVLEKHVADMVHEHRKNRHVVTRDEIRIFALQWAKSNPEYSEGFKAPTSWCSRFVKRHNLLLRQKTRVAQKLPSDLDCKLANFHKCVIQQRRDYKYPSSNIGNVGEISMNFDMTGNQPVDCKGVETELLKTVGHEKTQFTVVLSCMADGTKLSPMVIFKRKNIPQIKFPIGVFVHVNEKGWMDDEGVKLWLDHIWSGRPGGLRKQHSLLVWDMFKSNLSADTKKQLAATNTVIPEGLTSLVQPLDMCLNKPFKDCVQEQWNEWISDSEKSFTKGSNMHAPQLDMLCNFVINAWNDIPVEMVISSFKKCNLSDSLDGMQENYLWNSKDTVEHNGNETEVATTPLDAEYYPFSDSLAHVSQDIIYELTMSDDEFDVDFEGFS